MQGTVAQYLGIAQQTTTIEDLTRWKSSVEKHLKNRIDNLDKVMEQYEKMVFQEENKNNVEVQQLNDSPQGSQLRRRNPKEPRRSNRNNIGKPPERYGQNLKPDTNTQTFDLDAALEEEYDETEEVTTMPEVAAPAAPSPSDVAAFGCGGTDGSLPKRSIRS